VDVSPAAANTICVGLLSHYAAPFDVAGSLPTPDSISEIFHILGRYFHTIPYARYSLLLCNSNFVFKVVDLQFIFYSY